MKITNKSDIPLALAVWLLMDEYDYIDKPNYISVTKLMKPLKQIVLEARVNQQEQEADLEDYISRALGHSLHDSVEKSWRNHYQKSLKKLGYPESVIQRVLINPTPEELAATENPIPVYLEQRGFREVTVKGKTYTVGGKFDMVAEGIVHDNKSTTAYSWVFGNNDENYQLQGSLYRWINPEIITQDFIRINFIFTDWQKAQAKANPKYPKSRLEKKEIPLMTERDTDLWVKNKINLIQTYWEAPENAMPECTKEELWMSDPQYKYYSDPEKTTGRSTRNFDTLAEANQYWRVEKKGKGIVITVPGEVKRCAYCNAAPVCQQRLRYI